MAAISFDDLTKQFKEYSDLVSKGVRTVAFGTIAAIWAVATADGITLNQTGLFQIPTEYLVRASFVLAAAALLADLLQYITAYWMTSIGIDKWDEREAHGEKVEFYYDKKNLGCWGELLYKLSFKLLPLKLSLSVLGATAFLFLTVAVTVTKPG